MTPMQWLWGSRSGRTLLTVLIVITSVGVFIKVKGVPDLGPALGFLYALLAGIIGLCVVMWRRPADLSRESVQNARNVRTAAAGVAVALAAGTAMFMWGFGGVTAVLIPVLVVIGELAALAGVAGRAVYYATHPAVWAAKQARKEEALQQRLAARAAADDEGPFEYDEPEPVDDDLAAVDLGGDDEDEETAVVHGSELIDRSGVRMALPGRELE